MSDQTNLESFVTEEVERLERSTRRTYQIGAVLFLAVVLYLGTILSFVNRSLVPEDIGMMLVTEAEYSAETLIEGYRAEFAAQAQPLIEDWSRRISEEYIPGVGVIARTSITELHSETIPELSREFASYVESYVQSHAEQLRLIESMADDEILVKAFTDDMIDGLLDQIDSSLNYEHPGVGSLAYVGENIDTALVAIDEMVANLSETDPKWLSRSDRLKRRILAQLVRMAFAESDALGTTVAANP